jgi:hypothetical protein
LITLDAKIAAAEARTDTKIMRLEGKVDLVLSNLSNMTSKFDALRDDNRAVRANQWVIGLGLAVLIVAVAALFPVFFSIGTQVRDLIHSEVKDHCASTGSPHRKVASYLSCHREDEIKKSPPPAFFQKNRA